MTRIDELSQTEDACRGACGRDCGACGRALRLTAEATDQADADETDALDPEGEEVDVLTRGLLGSFARFIAEGDHEHETESELVETLDEAPEPSGDASSTAPSSADMDDALDRIEQALEMLAAAMPSLEERLSGVERRIDEGASGQGLDADQEPVARGLKDRLASVQRECDRLASVPIERVEARVSSAERTLGSLIERAESTATALVAEREATEHAAERLSTLVEALAPWRELLELRDTEDGLPKPIGGLIRMASGQLGREMAAVRGNLDQLARVLELPESERHHPLCPDEACTEDSEEDVVTPQRPDGDDQRKPRRRKNGKSRAIKAKGADAESPRRSASDSRLSAAARLRARSRAEGRPPRR